MSGRVPGSLRVEGLVGVWAAVRDRLESRGTENRGRVRLPDLDQEARLTLKGLIGRPPTATLDLRALEQAFQRLGLADDLAGALALLGAPVSPASIERRLARHRRDGAREAARAAAAEWPVPWASDWIEEVIGAGMLRGRDAAAATELVTGVREVLSHLGLLEPRPDTGRRRAPGRAQVPISSRTELAASVLGDAHALDRGRTAEAATVRAIRASLDLGADDDPWSAVGVHADLVSAPVLTWGLPLLDLPGPTRLQRTPDRYPAAASARTSRPTRGGAGLAGLVAHATAMGVPIHLTAMVLRDAVIAVAPGTVVLVAENPRVIEAAAERRVPVGLVCTNGNPSTTVRLLIDLLLRSGARLRYHGDIDTPGLAICARMQALGVVPWRMGADEYWAALAAADADGVVLPVDGTAPGPTPWDPALREVFDAERRIVHEERVLDALLDALGATARG